jgi:hypothetical protein
MGPALAGRSLIAHIPNSGMYAPPARLPLVRLFYKFGQVEEFSKSSIQAAHSGNQWLVDVNNPVDTFVSQRLLDAGRIIFVGCDVIKDLGIGEPGRVLVSTAFAGQIIDSVMTYRPLC